MSLINKMLQDLDARGSQGGEPMPGEIRPVPRSAQAVSTPMVVIALLSAGVLAGAGMFGWRAYKQRIVTPTPVVLASVPTPVVPAPTPAPIPAATPTEPAGPAAVAVPPAPAQFPLPAPVAPAQIAAAPADKIKVQKPARQIEYWGERTVAKKTAAVKSIVTEPPVKAIPAPAAQLSSQRGEGEYRRALNALGEGRVGDAIAGLEQTLRLDPRHDAARQTLVGLLIEHRRPDDAMRQLQTALSHDPRQPTLAMLLARMQIERGVSGIETLQRTLPSAAGNADYHAFLAGALQREGRNREAAEQFTAALRSKPQQGVWLMGLGIALQADKRNGEAVEAFERAKASGSLSGELQAFVERRLTQLTR